MPTLYSLNDFQQKITDIARPYHFTVEFKGGCFDKLQETEKVSVALRTAALPSLTVTPVTINYFGMEYKIAGAPTYDQLACQFIIDAEYKVREAWRTALDHVYRYSEPTGPLWNNPESYMGTVTLNQLQPEQNATGSGNSPSAPKIVQTYKLSMAWISILGNISYDQGTKDSPLVFDATIVYSFYTKGK